MVFDEIDANIGGKTASIVGEKLRLLGQHKQVIAITHFPQIAQHADHHLHVFKEEIDSRVQTKIIPLKDKDKKDELIRMVGGKHLFPL